MFKKYDGEIIKLLEEKKEANWKEVLVRHRLMISRIQHERLIHLLVTMLVGTSAVWFFLAELYFRSGLLGILTLVLLGLFAAYIFHYRFLENTTQKWYELEDEIGKRVRD